MEKHLFSNVNFLAQTLLLSGFLMAISCKQHAPTPTISIAETGIEKTNFGNLPDGRTTHLFTMKNKAGMTVKISDFGGIVQFLSVPDHNGKMADVVLGCDSLAGYLRGTPYFGALIGRYGNRIAKGKFTLDGKKYTLAQNNIGNSLHGGLVGFDKVLWTAEPKNSEEPVLKLTYLSKNGEEGYPGNLTVTVVYTLQKNNGLKIDYAATTDQPTVVNLTNHTYFNLAGHAAGSILGHELTLDAPFFLPVDKTLIPTGELKKVENTIFDFTKPHKIGERIADSTDQQIRFGGGYDHAWVFSKSDGQLRTVALLSEPTSGRAMEISTTEPAIQFYSGNFLDGTVVGKGGMRYAHRTGLCLETEHFPDSPNQPNFPTTVLRPGETYQSTTIYRFFVQ